MLASAHLIASAYHINGMSAEESRLPENGPRQNRTVRGLATSRIRNQGSRVYSPNQVDPNSKANREYKRHHENSIQEGAR